MRFLLTFALSALFFSPVLAGAHDAGCKPRKTVLERLVDNGFVPKGSGITYEGRLVQMYFEAQTEEWLLWIVDVPSDRMCAMAGGTDWRFQAPPALPDY